VLAGGPVWRLLVDHRAPGRARALPLRFLAAVHRLVLDGRAPVLAVHYPSAGGEVRPDAVWQAFVAVVGEQRAVLDDLVRRPCQTNEVGRCAGLIGGFLRVAAETGLPLRVLEVGASAGLSLRWDAFRYGGGGASWGPPDSPVSLEGLWVQAPAHLDAAVAVVERRGCDPEPLDPTSAEGRLALSASLWADQTERFARLRGAIEVARAVPARVERASVDAWLPDVLAAPRRGRVAVVYHSVVQEYLGAAVRRRMEATLEAAGAAATSQAPLAWLRLEPVSALRRHGINLTLWPGGQERLLGTCGAHGGDVHWR
jgi:hypothetical protein